MAAPLAWHSEPEVTTKLWEYHDQKAKQPNEHIQKTKAAFESLMTGFRQYLQQKGIVEQLQYVGSCYSNVRVNLPVEYDVIFILRNGEYLEKIACGAPSFTYFEVSDANKAKFDSAYFEATTRKVSSHKVINKFTSFTDQWITEIRTRLPPGIKNIRRRAHGAAIQIDVYDNSNSVIFNIDLVPAFELDKRQPIEDRELFVAKQCTDAVAGINPQLTWRRSYSVKDKALLSVIDRGDGIHKVILRILKAVLSNPERPRPDLARITSYHVKTAMLHVHRDHPTADDWNRSKLTIRLFEVIDKLSKTFADGTLNDYFAGQNLDMVNVISGISLTNRQQISNVLSDVYKNKAAFVNFFQ